METTKLLTARSRGGVSSFRRTDPAPLDLAVRPPKGRLVGSVAVFLLGWTSFLVAGCHRADRTLAIPHASFQAPSPARPQPSFPWTVFDRRVAGIVTGAGWSRTEEDPTAEGVDRFVTVAFGDVSTLHLAAHSREATDLYLRCRPVPDERDGEPTSLTLSYEGASSQKAPLRSGWNDVRLPFQARSETAAFTTIELRFEHGTATVRPAPTKPPSRVRRAACSALALVPRGVGDPLLALVQLHGEELSNSASESARPASPLREIGLPIPANSKSRIELQVPGKRRPCGTEAGLVSAGQPAPVVRILQDGGPVSLEVLNDSPAPAELRLSLASDGDDPCTFGDSAAGLGKITSRSLAGPERRRGPNVFIYLIDTLRADALLGSFRGAAMSPAISSFARDAVIFENAWAPSSWTLPSVVSMMTGVHPSRHGVWRLDQELPSDGPRTLAEIFTASGYETVAFSQSWIAGPIYGLDRGFGDFFVSEQINGPELRTADILTLSRDWAVGRWNGIEPIFGYLHSVEPHAPYAPRRQDMTRYGDRPAEARVPPPLYVKTLVDLRDTLTPEELDYTRQLYQAEVRFADRSFGEFLALLRFLGLYDESIILLLSDHGEEFHEHGGFGHGRNLFSEVTRVPLLIKFPHGRWRGRSIDSAVSLTDLAPTLVEYLALDVDPGVTFAGESLLPLLVGEHAGRTAKIAEVVTHREGPASLSKIHRSLLLDSVRCVHISPFALDPGVQDLGRWHYSRVEPRRLHEGAVDPESEAARVCRATLERFERRLERAEERSTSVELLDDQLDALRSLGYLQ